MRHLLLNGQIYYLYVSVFLPTFARSKSAICSTNLVAILSAAIIAMSPVGPIYQAIFTVPATITETMATCKVFRAMILSSLDVHDQNLSGDSAGADTRKDGTVIELSMSLDSELPHAQMTDTEREQV